VVLAAKPTYQAGSCAGPAPVPPATMNQAFPSMDSFLWSPPFSFAWQPLGVLHDSVILGGVGISDDPVPGIVAATLSSNPWRWPRRRCSSQDDSVKGAVSILISMAESAQTSLDANGSAFRSFPSSTCCRSWSGSGSPGGGHPGMGRQGFHLRPRYSSIGRVRSLEGPRRDTRFHP